MFDAERYERNLLKTAMSKKGSNPELPDPDVSPHRAIVIWDGTCSFCRLQVERLRRFDSGGKLAYLSLHDPRVAERFPELTYQQLMDQMWVVTPDHRKFGGADAIRFLSRLLPTLWWLAPIMHIPFAMPVWRYFYGLVAERRYRLTGAQCEGGTCHVHGQVKRKS